MYLTLGLSVIAIMLASLTGAVFTWKFLGGWIEPRLRYLVALAAGVFVIIIFTLAEEALHDGFSLSILGAFLFGGVLLEIITRFMPKDTHHHHGPHPEHHHGNIDARRMLVGDAIHNIHDGLALVPAFLVSPVVGLGTAAGVLLHEIVQEIAEFFVLREAGYSVRKALTWNFLVSGTILIGIALAATLASTEELVHPLVAFSAGSFTYIVARDLLPSITRRARSEGRYRNYIIAFLLGIMLMGTVALLAPHEHEEELPLPDGFGLAIHDTSSIHG